MNPRLLLLISLFALGAPVAEAADAAPARGADAILDDFARAVGGAAAAKHKALHFKREIAISAMGLTGSEERWAAAGDKLLSVMTLPGLGSMKQGSTGTVRWSEDPINGLRVLAGAEGEMLRIESSWNAELRLAKLFASVRAVPPPASAPKEKPLECVELVPKVASPLTMCFDAATHLRVFQTGKQASPQGDVPYTSLQSDWRAVDGVMLPHKEELSAGPTTMRLRLLEAKLDEKLPPALFRMPKPAAAGRRARK